MIQAPFNIDWESFNENLDNDREIITEIIRLFLASAPGKMSEVKAAILKMDASAIEHAAHSLKGAIAAFGTVDVVNVAQTIENEGREKTLNNLGTLCTNLENLLMVLTLHLEDKLIEWEQAG